MDEEALLQKIKMRYQEARAILNARRGIRSTPMQDTHPSTSIQYSTATASISQEDQREILESTLARAECLPGAFAQAIKAVSASVSSFHADVNTMWNHPVLPSPLPPPPGKDERRTALDELRAEMEAPSKKKKVSKLSEASSSILLEWVTANIDNPYPTAKEKAELEHKTGLDQVQIANWLINYRKRKIRTVAAGS